MELAHWADHTETRLGLTKRAPVPGAEGTQVLTKLRSAPLRFCLLGAAARGGSRPKPPADPSGLNGHSRIHRSPVSRKREIVEIVGLSGLSPVGARLGPRFGLIWVGSPRWRLVARGVEPSATRTAWDGRLRDSNGHQ